MMSIDVMVRKMYLIKGQRFRYSGDWVKLGVTHGLSPIEENFPINHPIRYAFQDFSDELAAVYVLVPNVDNPLGTSWYHVKVGDRDFGRRFVSVASQHPTDQGMCYKYRLGQGGEWR